MPAHNSGRRQILRMAAASVLPMTTAQTKSFLIYWGTYTEGGGQFGNGDSKGIYFSRMAADTGKLTKPELAVESPNPSWLALHPDRRHLYAVNERLDADGKALPGEVSAFSVNPDSGELTFINRVPSRGGQPCHVAIDATGRMAMIANWSTGSTAAFPIGRHGQLGEATAFHHHEGPRSGAPAQATEEIHCHSAVVTPDNRFLFSTDTGLNKVYVYRLDPSKAALTPHDPPYLGLKKPTNPRHLALHPNAKWAYVSNEISPGGCTMLRFDAVRGVLEEGPFAASIPADYKGRVSSAECIVHPSGKFVYVSNRGPNSITVFRVDPEIGTLTVAQSFLPGGETPRSFAIDPGGAFLIAMMQRSGTILPLRIDARTGELASAADPVQLSRPVCAVFVPT